MAMNGISPLFSSSGVSATRLEQLKSILREDVRHRKGLILVWVYGVILAYNLILYHFDDGTAKGDDLWYWNAGYFYLRNGSFSFYNYFDGWPFPSFRGYLVPLVTLSIRYFSDSLNIHYKLVFCFLAPLCYACFVCVLLPRLYEALSDRACRIWQVFLFFLVLFLCWRGYFYYLLLDYYSLMAFVACFAHVVLFLRNRSLWDLMFSSFWLILAIQMRTNYLLALFVFIILIGYVSYSDSGDVQGLGKGARRLMDFSRASLVRMMVFFVPILLISIPQFIINRDSGHFGFFPYDAVDSYSPGKTLLLHGFQAQILYHMGHPFAFEDLQGVTLFKTFLGIEGDKPTLELLDGYRIEGIKAVFELWIGYPLDFLLLYIKRVLCAVDLKFSNPYPDMGSYSRYVDASVVTAVNYFLIFTGLFTLVYNIRKKIFNNYEKLLTFLMILLCSNYLLFHIEWRYFITFYFLMYYLVIFRSEEFFRHVKASPRSYVCSFLVFLAVSPVIMPINHYVLVHHLGLR